MRTTLIAGAVLVVAAIPAQTQILPTPPAANDSVTSAFIGRETPWPRRVRAGGTTLIVHAPQVDAWDGFALTVRFAVSAARASRTCYGVITIDARTLTDKGTRVVAIDRAHVVTAKFSGATREESARWSEAIAVDLVGPSRLISLDRLETALAAADVAIAASQAIDTTPPRIIFASSPTLLVYIDGPPEYHAVAGTHLQRVVNTRPLILLDSHGTHYLRIFDGWLSAASLDGTWRVVENPEPELAIALAVALKARVVDELSGRSFPGDIAPSPSRAPIITVVTAPTELIVTRGPGNWTPVHGLNDVFYLLNTTGRVLKSGQDFKIYALVAGRWFRATTLRGPWTYVAANRLPSHFAKIPDSSPIENVKASIPGTKQAREAAIATTIAQTSWVTPTTVRYTLPRFDGVPAFKAIEGTTLEYVVNTATPIVRVSGAKVYSVENGVWFTAASVDGPWSLATSIPVDVYSIPSTSPLYYVTFSRVLATAGDTVFVGYTPGYLGAYIEPTTSLVVYGTGYTYPPWIGAEWIGAPTTYGFASNLTYTPWTGWTVGLGLGWAWGDAVIAGNWGWGAYPWWGPWGWGTAYGPDVLPWNPMWTPTTSGETYVWSPGGWLAYSGDIYRRWNTREAVWRLGPGFEVWTANSWVRRVGLSYNSCTGIAISGQYGALDNVRAEALIVRARQVAVTTSGAIVPARPGAFFEVRAGDRVVPVRRTERTPSRESAKGRVGRVGDDLYAGQDGKVYRRTDRGWQFRGEEDWELSRRTDALLDEANAMRDAGDQRISMVLESMRTQRSMEAERNERPH